MTSPALPSRGAGRAPPPSRNALRHRRVDRADRRRGVRRRLVQGRLHRPGHRVPEGAGHARTALPGAVGHAGHARLHRRRPRPLRRQAPDRRGARDDRAPAARRRASKTRSRPPTGVSKDGADRVRDGQLRPDRDRPRREGARAPRAGDGRPAGGRDRRRDVRRADRRRRDRRVPGRRGGRTRDRRAAAARGAAQPARHAQRARRRVRRHRVRLRRADVGRGRHRRARARARRSPGCSGSAPASTTRCCWPRASRRSCAPATARSRRPSAPTPPPAIPP